MVMKSWMEPGPWYEGGVEIGCEDMGEEELFKVTLPSIHPAITRDEHYNFPRPSKELNLWLIHRLWTCEGMVRMTDYYEKDGEEYVDVLFEDKIAAQAFKLVWA